MSREEHPPASHRDRPAGEHRLPQGEALEPHQLRDAGYAKSLDRLLEEIETLPTASRDRVQAAADDAARRHAKLCQSLDKLQETLDFLRLGVKYMAFDVEATKRENTYLRKLLDEAAGED
jgi:hypothetical protein